MSKAPAPTPAAKPKPQVAIVSRRALVVDDEESIRGIVVQVLTDEGYQVTQASSGEEALAMFQKQPFPVVFTDVRMSGMSGLDLLKRLKQLKTGGHVIIMTSHGTMDVAVNALTAGAYDFLHKPFDDLELIANVAKRAMQSYVLVRERERLMATLKSRNEAMANLNKAFKALTVTLKNKNQALENLNEAFKAMAIRDDLTGLFNRRYFDEAIASEVVRATRYNRDLTLIFLDVDHFKNFNDEFGHQLGDTALKKISAILKELVRETDIATRYGGEEFIVILPETSKEDARAVAEKIRETIAGTTIEGAPKKVTISAGVATLGQDGNNTAELIGRADQAVYQAKRDGRDRVCVAGS
ncbi:MAG: diguanylate cyclase [Acidiferrobacterales bacterium]